MITTNSTGELILKDSGTDRELLITANGIFPFDSGGGFAASTGTVKYIPCEHCGDISHGRYPAECPRVKAIEYHDNGKVKRVVYRKAARNYGQAQISWTATGGGPVEPGVYIT